MVGAPKGHQNSVKLKTEELKRKAYKAYCDWIAQGKSSRSFVFEEGDLQCIGQTIENYMDRDPINFPAINKQVAYAKGMQVWEAVVEDSAKGKNKEANTASLQMLMRNKFGWDKQEKQDDERKKLSDLKNHALADEELRSKLDIQSKSMPSNQND